MSLTFKLVRSLTRFVVFIFFGEVDIAGMENLAKHGPVILVGKIMHGIPVVRAADKARGPPSSEAKLVDFRSDSNIVVGTSECQFMSSVKVSESLVTKGLGCAPLQIVEVLSDTEVRVKPPVKHEDEPDALTPLALVFPSPVGFKILPKIDQSEMFAKTFDALGAGKCVCLFPEGGSSDRTDLLPLKAGVSVMALGAAAQGTKVHVVPFGLNYNQASAWRSRVLVDVGQPIPIPNHVLEDFRQGKKREAYAEFLTMVESGLRGVTLNAPDQQTLAVLKCMRRMYQGEVELAPKRFMELNRKFVLAFHKFRTNEEFLHLVELIDEYLEDIKYLSVRDKEVAKFQGVGSLCTSLVSLFKLMGSLLEVSVLFLFSVPAFVVFAPMLLRINRVVKKEVSKALAGSTVKVKAHDVVASQKIMGAVIWYPITVLVWALVLVLVGGLLQFLLPGNAHTAHLIWILPVAFLVGIVPYSYMSIRAMDWAVRARKRQPSQWLIAKAICRSESKSVAGRLRQRRRQLVLEIQEFFEFVVVPQMEEWRVDPIVHRQTIVDRRRPSEVKRALAISTSIRAKDFEAQVMMEATTVPKSPSPRNKVMQQGGEFKPRSSSMDLVRRKSGIREAVKNMQDNVVGSAFGSTHDDDGTEDN
ncbi:hypothetical protein BASA81_012145 [Batrachochytrium salamandrivorans]|nr:hypothetical protein BASA81_012145 [Batrachochytrium salamandrivorans]